jgi:hypothetical protein
MVIPDLKVDPALRTESFDGNSVNGKDSVFRNGRFCQKFKAVSKRFGQHTRQFAYV